MFYITVFLTAIQSYFSPITEEVVMARQVEIKDETLKNEVFAVAGQVLHTSKDSLIIKQHNFDEDIAESGSESEIFYVYDEQENPLAVMKKESINPQYFSEHEYEYLTIDSLSHMGFKHFHSVKLYGVFEGPEAGEQLTTSGYIVESMAKGKTLNGYVKEVGRETDLQKREALFQKLKIGIQKTALGLGELHNKKSFSKSSKYFVERFHDMEETGDRKIAATLPGPFGLIHGDLHLGNIFYDEEKEEATFIDLASAYHALSGGPVAQDIANFTLAVELLGSYHGLTEQEIHDLNEAFYASYQETGPYVTQSAIDVYRQYFLLVYTQDISDWDEKQKGQAQYIFNYCKNELDSIA